MRFTLGEMLYRFRIERQIEASQICKGLCSTSAMNFFEIGERVPDTLLFECIAERMGVSSEEFSLMVTEEEYVYHVWQEQVYQAIEDAEWDELGELLQSDIPKKVYCNKKLEKQFFSYASGIYCASQDEYVEAAEFMKIAAEQTIPNKNILQKRKVLLSTLELNILMLYIFYGVKGNAFGGDDGIKLFYMLEQYIYDGILDVNEKGKCYPKLVCIGLQCFHKQILEEEQISYCEKAVQILRENKVFYDVTELLRLYIELLEKKNSSELAFYKTQYRMFCELLKDENLSIEFRPEVRGMRKPKIFMIHEYLSSKRQEFGYTQEEVSEGICEPETYSRVENGKRAPSRRNFKALAERLDINWCNYCGELDTYELKAYELRREQRMADIEGRYQDSIKILVEMEEYLDMSRVTNYQYVKGCECVAKYRLGMLQIDETCNELYLLLKQTQNMNLDVSHLVYYTQTELEIIGHMAELLGKQDKCEEAIQLIEQVMKQMKNSRVNIEYQWNGFCFLLRVLCGLYFKARKFKMDIEVAEYVKSVMIRRRDGANLYILLDEIADSLEHIGEQYCETYKKMYRYTYYITDFFMIEHVKSFTQKYYEDNFGKNTWYYD